MHKTDIDLLFSYNRWANAKVLAACAELSGAQLAAPVGLSFGSLLGTLAHILGAEAVWRERLQHGVSPRKMPQATDFTDLQALAARWREEEDAMRAFLALLNDSDMERRARFTRLNGAEEEATVWKALAHVVLHGMQFRAEAGVALAALGHSPGDLDFIYYLRDIGAR